MPSDFSAGLGAGFAKARAVRADADRAVGEWKAFATNLQAKLLTETVERAVAAEYVRELRAALKAADPNHPLLKYGEATKLLDRARIRKYAEQGYQLDSSSGRYLKAR